MAKRRRLEILGEESGQKEDPHKNRKTDGQTHQDEDIHVCLIAVDELLPQPLGCVPTSTIAGGERLTIRSRYVKKTKMK